MLDKEKAQYLLFTSVELKHFELLKELLKLGVDINIKNEVGVAIPIFCSLNAMITATRIKPRLCG